MEENFEEKAKEYMHHHKHCWLKYLTIFFATLIGAFLAFYFAADMAIKTMMSPEYQMRHAHRMMQKQEKLFNEMAKDMDKAGKDIFVPVINEAMAVKPVHLKKEGKAYVITVDLKKFDNNPDNIQIQTDDNMITVSGNMKKDKRGVENVMSFSQTYLLDQEIDDDAITKKVQKDKYIITLPIKK